MQSLFYDFTKTEPMQPEEKPEEYVPSDSQGKPLFGIRAVRKTPVESTYTSEVTKDSSTGNKTLYMSEYK